MAYLDEIEVFSENMVLCKTKNFQDEKEFFEIIKDRDDLDYLVHNQIQDGILTVEDVEITYVRYTKTPEDFQDETDTDYLYTTGWKKGRGAIECYMLRAIFR